MENDMWTCDGCCLLWNREEMHFDTKYECNLCDECMAHTEVNKGE